MNTRQPYKINNINLDNIIYTTSKQTERKKVILIKYLEKGQTCNFVFQTPTLLNIHQPKIYMKDNMGYGEIDVALQSKRSDKVDGFVDFISRLEDKIKYDAMINSSTWFHNSPNTQNINFQNIIRENENKKIMKIKLLKNPNFETTIQYNNSQEMQMGDLPDNAWIKMLLEVYAVWINPNNDFGVFLRPITLQYTKNNYVYRFTPESDEENSPVDIPDTEISSSIFIKTEKMEKVESQQATSAMELNTELLNNYSVSQTSHEKNIPLQTIDSKSSSTSTSDESI